MPVRLDNQLIEDYIEPGARVLDLGCGDGTLLEDLMRERGVEGCGIDVDLEQIHRCILRGVPVYHGDMIEGMGMFEDGRFDCVVLSQTLQQTLDPRGVVREMLRVGRRGIISFPNFGYWRVRLQLLFGGRMPVTQALPYRWHDTPNIRVLTIRDFHTLCRDEGIQVVDEVYLSSGFRRLSRPLANWRASTAIFVVQKDAQAPK